MYIKTAMGIERVNVQSITSVRLMEVKDPEYDGTMFGVRIEQYSSEHPIVLSFIDRHDADEFMENMYSEIVKGGSNIINVSGLATFVDHVDNGNESIDSEEESSEE